MIISQWFVTSSGEIERTKLLDQSLLQHTSYKIKLEIVVLNIFVGEDTLFFLKKNLIHRPKFRAADFEYRYTKPGPKAS